MKLNAILTADEVTALPTQQIVEQLAQISRAADRGDYSWSYDTFRLLEIELASR